MKRRILEEHLLYKTGRDDGIHLTSRRRDQGIYIIVALHYDKRSHLMLRHMLAGKNHSIDPLRVVILRQFLLAKESQHAAPLVTRTQSNQRLTYLVLEEDDQNDHRDRDHQIEDAAQQSELEESQAHPKDDDGNKSLENDNRAISFRPTIKVEHQSGNAQNVYQVFCAKFPHIFMASTASLTS